MKRRITANLDDDLWRRFRICAIREGKSASRILEELIRKRLERDKRI